MVIDIPNLPGDLQALHLISELLDIVLIILFKEILNKSPRIFNQLFYMYLTAKGRLYKSDINLKIPCFLTGLLIFYVVWYNL